MASSIERVKFSEPCSRSYRHSHRTYRSNSPVCLLRGRNAPSDDTAIEMYASTVVVNIFEAIG